LRLSEARLLKKENADFNKGILTILESKGRKDRLVYLPPDGIEALAAYLRRIEKEVPGSPWLFPGKDKNVPISASAVQRRFKDCWNRLPFVGESVKAQCH
jgi:integrase